MTAGGRGSDPFANGRANRGLTPSRAVDAEGEGELEAALGVLEGIAEELAQAADAVADGLRVHMGESWHHNHHAFPRSARHGLRWYEIDLAAYAIRALKATGLAWNVVEISPERQAEKAAARPRRAQPA